MKIYLLLAHPNKETLNGHLADAYEEAARQKGHEVRRQNIGEMRFDPILWKGYKEVQALEPDLQTAWENIQWCEHWVIVYPVWWGSLPALFKGFLDRVMLPGKAFKYHDNGPFWDKLLKGRSAQLITTSDAPAWWLWLMYRNSDINTMRHAVLKFCGFSSVKAMRFSGIRMMKEAQKQGLAKRVARKVP